jgi:hypothetical protein
MEDKLGSEQKLPAENPDPAQVGNASNPSPQANAPLNKQLLPEEAEKYLREAANIEDEPDAVDQQELDEILKKQKEKDE